MKLPPAIVFDLDDTISVAFGPAQSQWRRTIASFAHQLGQIEAMVIAAAIEAASTELWSIRRGTNTGATVLVPLGAASSRRPLPRSQQPAIRCRPRRPETHWPTAMSCTMKS